MNSRLSHTYSDTHQVDITKSTHLFFTQWDITDFTHILIQRVLICIEK